MIVLGIETSCDDTGVAIYDYKHKKLLADVLHSQIDLHADYGGVVPELASRDHLSRLQPLVNKALVEANIKIENIDLIAYTAMPGLIGALMVGATYAKSMAYALKIPSISIHHLEGHLMAQMLDSPEKVIYPHLALIVSGGHTQLIQTLSFGNYKIIGESLDDAAGEAFDKTAKLLGLPYPGGPHLAKLAEKGLPGSYVFPKPMTNRPGLDFSFSGLKTAVLKTWSEIKEKTTQEKANVCLAFEDAMIETIFIKCKRAIIQTNAKQLIIAGGVSANRRLRLQLDSLEKNEGVQVLYPKSKYCTDNGAMIAIAGAFRFANGYKDSNLQINVKPRFSLEDLI